MLTGLKPYPQMKDSGMERLGAVPAHWDVRRLGQIGTLLKGRGGSKEDEVDEGVPCVRYGDLYTTHTWVITKTRSSVSKKRASEYMPIQFGDVLFAASGETADEIGKSAVNLIRSRACCGGDIILFRPRGRLDARFMGYAADCRAAAIQKAMMGRGFTVVHIYPHQIKRVALALPPLPEQVAIARFLDHANSRIERYIRAKEKLITLLETQKQVIVHDAVTGRVDVRTGRPYPAYKPSGADWLGDVPAHWEVRRLKGAASILNGATPSTSRKEYWDGDLLWVTPEDLESLQGQRVTDSARKITAEGHASCGTSLAARNSIVISTRAPIGHLGILASAGCTNQGCKLLIPNADIASEYLFRVLESGRSELRSLGQGTTFAELSKAKLGTFRLSVPPLREQTAITRCLDDAIGNIASTTDRANREIELLGKYRTRLIADVVTGKLDVREAAAELPEVEPYATGVASGWELDAGDAKPSGGANLPPGIAS